MVIIRKGSFTAGSTLVTGLKRTSDLTEGLFVYGSKIPVGAYITDFPALPADQTLNMNAQALASSVAPESFEITNANVGVYLERQYALADTKFYVDERGDLIKIYLRNEADVTRDAYNSIKKRELDGFQKFFRTFPVQYSPSVQQLEKAGIKEQTDVVIYTAFKDWLDAGVGFGDIDISGRLTVAMQGELFEIKAKGLKDQFNDAYLYITLGLSKK